MRRLRVAALLGTVALLLLAVGPAAARQRAVWEPPVKVPRAKLEAAFHCHGEIRRGGPQALLFVTGTGASGEQGYLLTQGAFAALGRPVCDIDFPDFTTADIQLSAQYLVYAIRREYRMAGRPIAIFGISQGGLLPRFALTYWPSLRAKVSDVLAAAGTQHGTTVGVGACSETAPCPPAYWQQAAGSNLLRALNRQRFEAPGPTAWTTIRTTTDETVQPTTGPHPTSALRGAANIVIQAVCPGRVTTHVGTTVDSVSFAAFADAISHRGPAKVSRLPADVCEHPYATGLDERATGFLLSSDLTAGQGEIVPLVTAEPKVRAYVKRLLPRPTPPRRSQRSSAVRKASTRPGRLARS